MSAHRQLNLIRTLSSTPPRRSKNLKRSYPKSSSNAHSQDSPKNATSKLNLQNYLPLSNSLSNLCLISSNFSKNRDSTFMPKLPNAPTFLSSTSMTTHSKSTPTKKWWKCLRARNSRFRSWNNQVWASGSGTGPSLLSIANYSSTREPDIGLGVAPASISSSTLRIPISI